jgi:signal transduction histidine kinase
VALALVHSGHFDLLFGDLLGGFLLGDWRIEIRIVNCLLGFLAISSFFEFRTTAPALHRASRGAILIVAGVLLSTTLAPVKLHDAMTAVVQIFSTVTIAAVLGVALRKRLVGSVALALAWGPIVLFTLYLASTRLGVLNIFESSKWTTLVPLAILGWQGLLSTLALSDKIRRLAELRHQKELRDLEAAGLERMVRVLCHDVSTPLATIGMTTDLIELNQQAGKPVDIATANNRLRGAFQAIKEIVDGARQVELLKLSGPELAREPVDLCAAFADAERMLQEKLKRKRLTVRRSAWPETAIVLAEPRMLRLSVIANALSNAIKFSHAGGVIDVSITREAGETILRIRDHGVGIPAELREMFNRSGRITSREGTMSEEGTGLGVILMRDFVEAMGGSLRLESRTDEESPSDHGTSVELRLRAPASAD